MARELVRVRTSWRARYHRACRLYSEGLGPEKLLFNNFPADADAVDPGTGLHLETHCDSECVKEPLFTERR